LIFGVRKDLYPFIRAFLPNQRGGLIRAGVINDENGGDIGADATDDVQDVHANAVAGYDDCDARCFAAHLLVDRDDRAEHDDPALDRRQISCGVASAPAIPTR
jgi:hypothetical protein